MGAHSRGAATLPARLAALAACGALLALAACGRHPGSAKPPEPGDVAAATVNGQTVWASDVRREAAAQGLLGPNQPLATNSELFHRMLDEMIDQKVLAAAATARGLQNDPAAQWRLAAARDRTLSDMLVEKAVAQEVNDKAIRGLYEEQLKLAKPLDELHAAQIVAATQPDAVELKTLLANGAAFDALAQKRSIDAATRFNGGDLGYFTLDVMPQAYADALKQAKIGDLVGPFQTDAGWVLVKVLDRRPQAPIPLDEARPQIIRFLTYDTVRELLERQRAQAQIKILVPPAAPGGAGEPASAPAPEATAETSLAQRTLQGGPPSGLRPPIQIAPAPAPNAKAHP